MGGDVETIKQRLDIAEIVGGYVKLEKAGASFKGRCPFHNEKTPSFFVSPARQSFYCFGCGEKGDIFTFVQEMEGVSFREALKSLAERAGVELKGAPSREARSEKEILHQAVEVATQFFEKKLSEHEEAKRYLLSRGLKEETMKEWRLGYAPGEWRSLYNHMLELGFKKDTLLKAGLVKPVTGETKEPYDVFRDRVVFPLSDSSGEIIAFSGRALSKDTEPKYLNSPDTILFTKSDVLYGLSKAKDEIRKKNYAVLVEGQLDLLLSHQIGVGNTVASSGTAFTHTHLERLKRLSQRIILAFDGDPAGKKAAYKSTALALSLGLEVKIASLPEGRDPADVAKNDPNDWKEILRQSKPAIEHFLLDIVSRDVDRRKQGIAVQQEVLPFVALLESSIERAHFVSLIARRIGIKEEMVWEDLRKVKKGESARSPFENSSDVSFGKHGQNFLTEPEPTAKNRKELIEERLTEVRAWMKDMPELSSEALALKKEESELMGHLAEDLLREELSELTIALLNAETSKDSEEAERLTTLIQEAHQRLRALDQSKKML